MKTYIVNLPQAQDRRESVLAQCARFGLEAEVYPAVYGKDLPDDELRRRVDAPALDILTKGEIGCTLSHLGIYRDMVEKDIPIACVLEDDAVFLADPRPVLDGLARRAAAGPEAYILTRNPGGDQYIDGGGAPVIGGHRFHPGWRAFGTYGYVVTQSAARNILALQTPVKFVCDWWKVFRTFGIIRLFLCRTEIVGVHPEMTAASYIEPDRRPGQGRRRKIYTLRRTPILRALGYYLRKLQYCRRIKRFPRESHSPNAS